VNDAPLVHNVLSWVVQTILVAGAGALLPIFLRVRHPRTQLAYCHILVAACLLLPVLEPWQHAPAAAVPSAAGGETLRGSAITSLPAPPAVAVKPSPAPQAAAPNLPPFPQARIPRSSIIWLLLAAGAAGRLAWLLAGLWRIRRYRIAAMPLYPIPESVRAASSVTHADAVLCISPDVPGPVTFGWLTPVVLLPESFLALGEEAQCAIVCHELLHVHRNDWLVTLLEELSAAVLWFNPGIWLLLAETRLAREQLVDAETVRLTAAFDSYVEALLAIARARPSLDLAPAPLFLRKRHLTQRIHALLKEVPMSRIRLLASYASMTAILACAGWFASHSFPLMGRPLPPDPAPAPAAAAPEPAPAPQVPAAPPSGRSIQALIPLANLPVAPVPGDPHEPVTGPVQAVTAEADRTAALALWSRARRVHQLHLPGTPPYQLVANFTAGGSGTGTVTETWWSGQKWRWTGTIGNSTAVRVSADGLRYGEPAGGAIPTPVHMVRNAIFWAAETANANAQMRSAAVIWNGKPATCLLFSYLPATETAGPRSWDEDEYCIDNASGLLAVRSIAPGTYVEYSYGDSQFHGRSLPSRIAVYEAGANVLDARMTVTDAGPEDPSVYTPTPHMLANGPLQAGDLPYQTMMMAPSAAVSGTIKPVIVHASVDGLGNVQDIAVTCASDPALAQPALDQVRNRHFPPTGFIRQMYIDVRFVPGQ
jgi:beta-lactamase regulating signal transducer with metallopeptidase domain